jgi:inorganic pyrophosphatase
MSDGAARRPPGESPGGPGGPPVGRLFRAHPWHGVAIGERAPEVVTTYVEIVPADTFKFEIDKDSGYLTVDRPQQYSNVCPTLYGFVPRTYCAEQVAARCAERIGRPGVVGDGDPLDICVLAEMAIPRGDILLRAVPIGGLRVLDGNEADDKIIAVLEGDAVYGTWRQIDECPRPLLDRLRHYFLTYKELPGEHPARPRVEIAEVYGREEAHEVLRRSQQDYAATFGRIEGVPRGARGG